MMKLEEKLVFSEARVQYGGLVRKWNPKMKPYIFRRNKNYYLLHLPKIIDCLSAVKEQVKKMSEEGKVILFVSTNPRTALLVKEAAISCESPYLVHRWLGGFLTNFETINKRITYLQYLTKFQETEQFANLLKKEKVSLTKKFDKLNKLYQGVITLKEKPHVLLIVGVTKEKTAMKEAHKLGIPIIAVANTSCNPDLVDYLVPGNDNGEKAVNFFANSLAESIKEGKELRKEHLMEKQAEREEFSARENFN